MEITEELKKQLPVMTEEESKEYRRYSTEELIRIAIEEFNKKADEIDAMYDEI